MTNTQARLPVVPEQKPSAVPYRVRVTADVLNIRKGPGTGYAVAGQLRAVGFIPSSKRKTELAPNHGESLKAALDGFLLIIQAEYNALPKKRNGGTIMDWLEILKYIAAIASGLAAAIPLVIQLVKYIKRLSRRRTGGVVLEKVMKLMETARD